jgi:hypothetical protein
MNYICIYNKYIHIFTMHTQWNECECLFFRNVSWTVIKFTHMCPRETGKLSGFDSRRGRKRGGMRKPGDRKPAVNSHSLTPEVP